MQVKTVIATTFSSIATLSTEKFFCIILYSSFLEDKLTSLSYVYYFPSSEFIPAFKNPPTY